jgi:hypothetical protein
MRGADLYVSRVLYGDAYVLRSTDLLLGPYPKDNMDTMIDWFW